MKSVLKEMNKENIEKAIEEKDNNRESYNDLIKLNEQRNSGKIGGDIIIKMDKEKSVLQEVSAEIYKKQLKKKGKVERVID